MDSKEREAFLKHPRLDILNRHQKKRIEIAKRWAKAGDPETVEPLMTVVGDQQDDFDVRIAAIQALGSIGDESAVPSLTVILSNSVESGLHLDAINALANIDNDKAIKVLIDAWSQVKALKIESIYQVLIELGPKRTVGPLIEGLGHSSPTVREQARITLLQLKDITPHLIAALDHKNVRVRESVQILLTKRGDVIVSDLLSVLEQADDQARDGAIETLVQIGEPAIEELIPLAIGENERAAEAAADVLVSIGKPVVRTLIANSISHPEAVAILVKMKDPTISVLKEISSEDVSLLVTALSYEDDDIRQVASERLSEIGRPAVPSLLSLLTSGDAAQVEIAEEVLIEMGSEAVISLLESSELGPQIKDILVEIGEPALPLLYRKLWNPRGLDAEELIDAMCAIAGTDRFSLAIDIYHRRIRPLVELIGADESAESAIFRGNDGPDVRHGVRV